LLAALNTDDRNMQVRIDMTAKPVGSLHRSWHRHCLRLLQTPLIKRREWLHDRFADALHHRIVPLRAIAWVLLVGFPEETFTLIDAKVTELSFWAMT